MLCSLQWSRCELINGYTFTPKDNIKDDIKDNIKDDENNSSDENNSDNEVLSDCEDEFDINNITYREEIEEIKLYNNNCNMKFMKQLLKEKRYDELINYYIHYFYRTNDGYYYYNNNSIIKNTYKNFEEDKINVVIN